MYNNDMKTKYVIFYFFSLNHSHYLQYKHETLQNVYTAICTQKIHQSQYIQDIFVLEKIFFLPFLLTLQSTS